MRDVSIERGNFFGADQNLIFVSQGIHAVKQSWCGVGQVSVCTRRGSARCVRRVLDLITVHQQNASSPTMANILHANARLVTSVSQTSGEGGIRTPDTLAGIPVFETGPINHSGTSPNTIPSG